jgi:hypothetical protein
MEASIFTDGELLGGTPEGPATTPAKAVCLGYQAENFADLRKRPETERPDPAFYFRKGKSRG